MDAWLANMLYLWFLLTILATAILIWIGFEIRELRKSILRRATDDTSRDKK